MFLDFIILAQKLKSDRGKICAIKKWSVHQTIKDVQSFHDLASFYRRFIKNFSSISNPTIECLKSHSFTWTKPAQRAFKHIKTLMVGAPALVLPNFEKLFVIECDASHLGIRIVTQPRRKPAEFFY